MHVDEAPSHPHLALEQSATSVGFWMLSHEAHPVGLLMSLTVQCCIELHSKGSSGGTNDSHGMHASQVSPMAQLYMPHSLSASIVPVSAIWSQGGGPAGAAGAAGSEIGHDDSR